MKRVQLLLLFLIAAALAGAGDVGAMVIRGDALWREQPSCPEGWQQPDFDDSTWAPVEFPWIRLWPYEWPLDAEARPFWGTAFHGINCVRRRFDLPQGPPLSAPLHIWVDDDYELFVNGVFVGASLDGTAARPGESYDVAAQLRRGGNVVAIRLRDTSGVMAALVSLTLSGVAEPRRGWREHARAWLPYGKAAAVVVAAVVWLLITRQIGHWCRRRAVDADAVDADSWAAAALAIALLCEGLLASLTLYSGQTAIPDLQWHWLSLALVMLALSLLWAAAAPCRWPAPVPASQQHRWLVIAIVALAAVLRIVWLDSIPTGFFQDEATNGNDALELATKEWRLWSESVGGRPTLFLYAMLPVLHLFGTNYLTLKVLPVTIGIATVAAVYWLGRVAFGSRMALWAAFLLAVSRWHIHYSRLAWEAICVPLFAAAGFALLLQGLARQGRAAALRVGAGAVLLGLGLYTYAAYRAAIAVAIVFGASVLLLRSESGRRIEQATAKIGLAGTVGLLVALPLILFAVRQPELYWHRYHDVSLTSFMAYYDTPMPWLHQIGRSLLSLNNAGDELIRHNLPGAAHLDPLTGTLFLLGLALAVWRWRQPGERLTLLWLAVFTATAALTRDGPHATRLLGVIVPAVLLAGVGAAFAADRLAQLSPRAGLAFVVVLSATLLASNAYQYFVLEAHHPAADGEYNFLGRTVCEDLGRRPDPVVVYWSSDVSFFSDPQCRFLAAERYQPRDLRLETLASSELRRVEKPTVVFVGREFLDEHPQLKGDNKAPTQIDLPQPPVAVRDRQGVLQYYRYDLPAQP